jgi:hypothetical protein
MMYQIPDEIISSTAKCQYGFACLDSNLLGAKPACEVDYPFGSNLMFLRASKSEPCPYRFPFGHSYVCSCPTHYAINKLETDHLK